MSPPNKEKVPYKRPRAGDRFWNQPDASDYMKPPKIRRGGVHIRPDQGTVIRLTRKPEIHAFDDSGYILGKGATAYTGKTIRGTPAHTHAKDETGTRLHIPASSDSGACFIFRM